MIPPIFDGAAAPPSKDAVNTSTRSPRRAALLVTGVISAILMLTGCATPKPENDPYFKELTSNSTLADAGFAQEGEPGTSCGGNTPFCTHPVFTINYVANSELSAEQACDAFVTTALTLANPTAYASTGSTAGPIPLFAGDIIVKDFCTQGLTTAMPNLDGTNFYQGTFLFDPGVSDQITKDFLIAREPDGIYRISIDFSRNLEALWYETGDTTPAHLTLEQVLQNNENTKQMVAVQEFANTLIGKTEKAALAAIEKAGYTSMVFQRDERETHATGSSPKRILLNIQDGVVFDALTG